MTTAPITPLTPAERRVADHLVRGLEPRVIAVETGLSPNTVSSYLRTNRTKLHCPTRSAPHVPVHRLLSSGQATPPSATEPTPDLTPARRLLLRTFAKRTSPYAVARDARIAPADVRRGRHTARRNGSRRHHPARSAGPRPGLPGSRPRGNDPSRGTPVNTTCPPDLSPSAERQAPSDRRRGSVYEVRLLDIA
ncbi:LuxR C-terminal-related transcriptional regulator [Streptomyces sp. NWU339]|uniref:LuxR C-terminal-related transcriptional regulator n=1 Tax=Streptomyces sp. NWU339 TaxID=2185284 RepID=UPI00215A9B32|nr:LuxR C-terminal-related transcriptional regulator [Streptomyces sp. NWU339]